MKGTLIAALTAFLLLSSCGAGDPSDPVILYCRAWAGQVGDDTLVFRFNAPGAQCPGVIHCINDGKLYSEMPMSTVTWTPPNLEIYMAPTNVTYTGEMRNSILEGMIGSLPIDLEPVDPASIPGLNAVAGVYIYSVPEDLDDGIPTDSLPRETAESLVERISSGDAGLIHSMLIWSGGALVFEEYFHGYNRDDLHRTMSTTKSISSLLAGIALDMGMIDSVSVPMNTFFPEFPENITLEHLLTMSMGLSWTDDEAEHVHETGDDFFAEVAGKEQAVEPGSAFRYVNADVNLLSGVIFQASGLYPDQFAEEYLFAPLGIGQYDWSYGENGNHRLMDGSLHLRPRDMLKIGVMVMSGGEWNGEQVVSPGWISASMELRFPVDELFSYGYLWWLTEVSGMKVWLASGWGSQFIAIIPDTDMVIVTTGGNDDTGKNWEILKVVAEVLFDRVSNEAY